MNESGIEINSPERPTWYSEKLPYTHGGNFVIEEAVIARLREGGATVRSLSLPDQTFHYVVPEGAIAGKFYEFDDNMLKSARALKGRKNLEDLLENQASSINPLKLPVAEPIEYSGLVLKPVVNQKTGTVDINFKDILERLQRTGVVLKKVSKGGLLHRNQQIPLDSKHLLDELPSDIVYYDNNIVKVDVGTIDGFPLNLLIYMPALRTQHPNEMRFVREHRSLLEYKVKRDNSSLSITADTVEGHYQSPLDIVMAAQSPTEDTLVKNPGLDLTTFQKLAESQSKIDKVF